MLDRPGDDRFRLLQMVVFALLLAGVVAADGKRSAFFAALSGDLFQLA